MSHLKTVTVPERAPRKVGVVQSSARDKTCKVAIKYSVKHRKYGKYIRRRTVLHVHDEDNTARTGDTVEIAECRPVSKTKSWTLLRVVKQGVGAE